MARLAVAAQWEPYQGCGTRSLGTRSGGARAGLPVRPPSTTFSAENSARFDEVRTPSIVTVQIADHLRAVGRGGWGGHGQLTTSDWCGERYGGSVPLYQHSLK